MVTVMSNHNVDLQRLLTIPEVAELLQVSTKTVRRMISSGDLPAHRLGRQWRIAPAELKGFLNRKVF
jgi:excisionase family DNA binding protein